MPKDINSNSLQKKIYSIVKKRSFTSSNILKILNSTIKRKGKTLLTNTDILEETLRLYKTTFAKKITQLYKTEKVFPKIHRKLTPDKQDSINRLYEEYSKIKGFQVPKEVFDYIANKMMSRIGKDIKSDILSKLDIYQDTKGGWSVSNYASQRHLLDDNEIDEDIELNEELYEEEFDNFWDDKINEDEKLLELKKEIIKNMGLIKEHDFEVAEKTILVEDLKKVVKKNFDGNYTKAIDVVNNNIDLYLEKFHKELDKIYGMQDAVDNVFVKSIKNKEKILCIADDDNDGNTLIASFSVFKRGLPSEYSSNLQIEPAKILPNSNLSHGLNAAHIAEMIKTGKIENPDEIKVLATFDNGMSLDKKEIDLIIDLLPNAEILITDHHLPSENLVPEGYRNKVKIVNPKYKPSNYFQKEKNISGAHVGGILLSNTIEKLSEDILLTDSLEKIQHVISNNNKFSSVADQIDGDISIYPVKAFDRDKLSSLSTTMNVVNNMKPFIKKRVIPEEIEKLFEIDFKEANGLSNNLLYLNSIAKQYIELFEELFGDNQEQYSLNEKNFNKAFADMHRNFNVTEEDENYIARLRPYLIELTNDPYKNIFKTKFLEHIETVFKELKKVQVKIVKKIQEKPLNFVEDSKKLGLETDRVSILLKKKGPEQKYINRKLLNIALNEDNNGYRAIMDNTDGKRISGSMRSIYSRKEIFDSVEEINKILNIKQGHAGHLVAAGWFIEDLDNSTDEQFLKKMSSLVKWIDGKVRILEEEKEKEEQEDEGIQVHPTENVEIILKANTLLRSSFAGHEGISSYIYLDDFQIETLERKIKDSKFGWITLDTKIMDCTLIFPIEVLKKYLNLRKEGKKASLGFKTLTSGAMILNDIRVNDKDEFIEKDKSQDEYNEKYIEENYHNNVEHIQNQDLQKQPYFQYNKYGDIEFQRVQATIISLMYRYDLETYNILDIEGTGLAMSEEIPEISTLTLKIDERTGSKLDIEEFNKRCFNSHGREILLDKKDLDNLVYLEEEEVKNGNYDSKYLIFNDSEQKLYYNDSKKYYPEIFSKVIKGDEVIFNQQLIGTHFHAYTKDLLENIPTFIESLTHLNNEFVKNSKNSLLLKELDEKLYKYFSSSKKSLLSAHNLSYDYSLIRSNFPKTFEYIHKEMLLYDTAKTSQAVRTQNQQYASIELPIAIGNLANETVKFRNYYGNDLSLEEFLEDLYDGREIVDKSGRFVLKVSNNNLVFIDKENDLDAVLLEDVRETSTDDIKEWLQFKKDVSVKPKYSVQSLLSEKYIKMMLHKLKPAGSDMKKNQDGLDELPLLNEEFNEFIKKYRFDNGITENINTFVDYVNIKYKHLELPDGESVIKHLLSEAFPYKPAQGKKPSARAAEKHVKTLYSDFINLIENNLEKFIVQNKDVSASYTNRFYAEEVIHLIPENLDRISDSMIKDIASKTSYSIEFVTEIIQNVKDFSKLNGVNVFSIGEVHNNLVAKDTLRMGDVAIEGMLAVLHLLNEKYNFLNKTNLTTQAVDFIEKGIIETAALDFNKRQKEDITTSQINSETFRKGQELLELRKERGETVQSVFADKIEKTLSGKTKLLKIDERLIQDNVLVYADIPSDYSRKEIDEVVDNIEIYMFLENLKQSKKAIHSYIKNLISKNSKNFVVNFANYFSEKKSKYSDLISKRYADYKKDGDVDITETFFAVTSIELYEDFNDLMAQLEVEILEAEGEIEDLENMEHLSKEEIDELNAFRKQAKKASDFKAEIDKVYEKVTSLNTIDELFISIQNNLELTQDELTEKYNLKFDYTGMNRKFKISSDIFELLSELQEMERYSFSKHSLSPKFVDRSKKPIVPSYMREQEIQEFKDELLGYINKEIIEFMNLPSEFSEKIEQYLDFLLNYYFINENRIESYKKEQEDNAKNDNELEKIKNMIISDFKGSSFSDNPKKFNNPSKEIVDAISKVGTGLSKFIVRSKIKIPEENYSKSVKKRNKKVTTSKGN